MRFRSLLPTVALLCALPALAADKPVPPPAPVLDVPPVAVPVAAPAKATKVFEVGDLVAPAAPDGAKAADARQANSERLVKLVTGMVRPYSWAGSGGAGKAEFYDLGGALVVTNAPDVLTEVGDLLTALRRLTAVTLTYEVRLVRAPAGLCAKAGLSLARDTALTEAQLRAVLDAAQAEPTASVAQLPKMTVTSDASAAAKVGEEQSFVTSVEAAKVQGQTVCVPKSVVVHIREAVTVYGKASADGNFARVRVGVAHARLVGKVELMPVVTQVTPVFEGGSQGKPVPFTQFLQAPDVRKEFVERDGVVPSGGTLVVGAWKETTEGKGGKLGAEVEVVALATVRVTKAPGALENCLNPPARVDAVCKLRNVGASDAVDALTKFASGPGWKGGNATITAEPVSNSVLISAEPDAHKKLVGILAELDKGPRQVVVQAMVLETTPEFIARAGLGAGSKVLASTEAVHALLREAKAKGEIEVLSRPQIQVNDNQTGYVNVGQNFPIKGAGGEVEYRPTGFTMRLTPRVTPDGKVLLRTETVYSSVQPGAVLVNGVASPVINEQKLSATTAAEFDKPLCLVGGALKHTTRSDDGQGNVKEHTEVKHMVVILTPHLVRAAAEVQPAAGWFTK